MLESIAVRLLPESRREHFDRISAATLELGTGEPPAARQSELREAGLRRKSLLSEGACLERVS